MIDKAHLIALITYNPSRRPDEPEQNFDENNGGAITMGQDAARLIFENGKKKKVLVFGNFNYRGYRLDELRPTMTRNVSKKTRGGGPI